LVPPFKTTAAALAMAAALGGCAWVSEETQFGLHREWQRLKGYDWGAATAQVTGMRDLLPTPSQREADADLALCLHPNGSERVMTQDGVNDRLEYRRCVLSPYATDAGQRMGRRPDGDGR